MTKFENIGIQRQMDSETIIEARHNFALSCKLCCERGLHFCDCDRCSIAGAHELICSIISDAEEAEADAWRVKLDGDAMI